MSKELNRQKASTMNKAFMRFLNDPSQENYMVVWQEVIESPAYAPYDDGVKTVSRLFEESRFEDAVEVGEEILPNFLLNPSLHFYLGRSSGELGDTDREELEKLIFRLCRDGLLSTGDGTSTNPYLVSHVEDEYDLLGHLNRQPTKQSVVTHENGRVFDVFSDADDSEVWFDITEMHKRRSGN